ncbi:hypothetical protein YC2023_050908 [Brassica napus]
MPGDSRPNVLGFPIGQRVRGSCMNKTSVHSIRLVEHQLGGRIAGGKDRSGNFEEQGGRRIDRK